MRGAPPAPGGRSARTMLGQRDLQEWNGSVAIHEIIWPRDRVEHIARHSVTPDEVEEVCFGTSLVLRGRTEGRNPVYHVLGQTTSGRHLLCIMIQFPNGRAYPVTARPMTDRERRRYRRWRRR